MKVGRGGIRCPVLPEFSMVSEVLELGGVKRHVCNNRLVITRELVKTKDDFFVCDFSSSHHIEYGAITL